MTAALVPRLWLGAVLCALVAACSAGGEGVSPGPPEPGGSGSGPASGGGSGNGPGGGSGGGVLAAGGAPFLGTGSGGAPAAGGSPGAQAGGATSVCDPPSDTPSDEICDGLDNDLDGFVDEAGCPCTIGAAQACFDGPPSQATLPHCRMGTQDCVQSGEFGEWGPCVDSGCGDVVLEEICDDGTDDDCDGLVDEGCALDAIVNLDGDCLSAFCPAQAPNPIGCQITMEGGDSRGCVSHASGSPEVYFQEGNACPLCLPVIGCSGGAGRITGTLRCSSAPTVIPLDASNCVINKAEPSYPSPTATPITQPVSGCAQ